MSDPLVALALLRLGVFLAAAVYSFALFLGGGRQRPHLLFGLHLLTCVGGLAPRFPGVRSLLGLGPAEQALVDLFFLVAGGVLLIAFFAHTFELPRRRLHDIVSVPTALLPALVAGAQGAIYAVLAYVLVLLAGTVVRRKPGALSAFLGVGVMTIGILAARFGAPGGPYLNAVGLVVFIFAVAISTSRQLRAQNRRHEATSLALARQEADLLKRVIQPHFLMNTLLSTLSWMRRDPGTAARLVEALGDEFRAVSSVSGAADIPLETETELCRNHLRLMGYRTDAQYRLETGAMPRGCRVPPLVLHTLVENGLTHAFAPGEGGVFRLDGWEERGVVVLRLRNDGSRLRRRSGAATSSEEEGLGLRYVRARLAAVDGTLECGQEGPQWVAVIRLPRASSIRAAARGRIGLREVPVS